MTLLPPNASAAERAMESAMLSGIDLSAVGTLWNPETCPAEVLPFLAWGLAISHWDSTWTEAEKRTAVAGAIPYHRIKGTRAAVREVLDRLDPLIGLVEPGEDPANLAPHHFRVELPLLADTDLEYDEPQILALLRDVAAAKPLRSQMLAVHLMRAQAGAYLLSAAQVAGFERLTAAADTDAALDPVWANYLQTETGEPILTPTGEYLETE